MSEIQAQISMLKQTADPAVADAIARLIDEGEDHELNRINVLDFSKRTGLDEERVISGFLHASLTDEVTLDTLELPAGEKATMSLQLPSDFIIVFEPVTHAAQFIDVQGEPTKEHQQLSLIYKKTPSPTGGTVTLRPGPLRLML